MRAPLIFLVVVTAACGVATPDELCQAACTGCCSEGVCFGGNAMTACGANGGRCDRCVAGQQTCGPAGRCVDAVSMPPDAGPPTCMPRSDAEICWLAGRECGALSVTDDCGAPRNIASCGGCTSGQVCPGTSGVCTCSHACTVSSECCGSDVCSAGQCTPKPPDPCGGSSCNVDCSRFGLSCRGSCCG